MLLSFGYTVTALRAGRFRSAMVNRLAILAGFGLLSFGLWHRGHSQGACPINSLVDILLFMSWAVLLIYLLVGPAYHLSLLGAFTSPLVFIMLAFALLVPESLPAHVRLEKNPWVDIHAALTMIAYGAFALAAVAGVMYLVQDRQLKKHQAGVLLYNLPPITHLGVANARLLWLGFALLTVGYAAGSISGMHGNVHVPVIKFAASALIWAGYGGVLGLRWLGRLSPKRTAMASIAVFTVALVLLPPIQFLSTHK